MPLWRRSRPQREFPLGGGRGSLWTAMIGLIAKMQRISWQMLCSFV
jgi:hypothetical protein